MLLARPFSLLRPSRWSAVRGPASHPPTSRQCGWPFLRGQERPGGSRTTRGLPSGCDSGPPEGEPVRQMEHTGQAGARRNIRRVRRTSWQPAQRHAAVRDRRSHTAQAARGEGQPRFRAQRNQGRPSRRARSLPSCRTRAPRGNVHTSPESQRPPITEPESGTLSLSIRWRKAHSMPGKR